VARRTHRDVVFVERETSSPIWWLLAGGALGAGLALLFAPETGEKTRRTLARRLVSLKDSAEGVIDDFRDAASEDDPEDDELVDEEGAGDDEVDEEASEDEALEDGDKPGVSPRAELEKRLAAVRARRQRAYAEEDEEPVA
jgi:gas vesicle protein